MPTTNTTTRRRSGAFTPTDAQRRAWSRTPATDPQTAMIGRLVAERAAGLAENPELAARVARAQERMAEGTLSKLAASECIDALMTLPRPERPEGAPRTNRYRGRCLECERWVDAGAGVLEQRDGRWVTLHPDCHGDEIETLADDDDEWEAF